MSKKGESS